jgi:hypothetical protein
MRAVPRVGDSQSSRSGDDQVRHSLAGVISEAGHLHLGSPSHQVHTFNGSSSEPSREIDPSTQLREIDQRIAITLQLLNGRVAMLLIQ